MRSYLLSALSVFCLLPSCSLLPKGDPKSEIETDPNLSKYAKAHLQFQEHPQFKHLIYRSEELIPQLTPENSRIEVTLSNRRARILLGEEIAIDTPISPGKKTHPTPTGSFKIIGKNKDHRSNLYGTIYDKNGKWIAGGDRRKHTMPEGGKFVGTKMPYWMRLTNTGIGLHVGYVPTYAASHGCIRLPKSIAPVIYEKTKVGTPVAIKP